MGNTILPIFLLGLICTVYNVPVTEDASAVILDMDKDVPEQPKADPVVDPMADFGKLKEMVKDDNAGDKEEPKADPLVDPMTDFGKQKEIVKDDNAGDKEDETELIERFNDPKPKRRSVKYENACTKAKNEGGTCTVTTKCDPDTPGVLIKVYRTKNKNLRRKMTYKVKGAPECKEEKTTIAASTNKVTTWMVVTGQKCSKKYGYLSKNQCRDYKNIQGYSKFYVVKKGSSKDAPLGCYVKTVNGELAVVHNMGPSSKMCTTTNGYRCVCDSVPNENLVTDTT